MPEAKEPVILSPEKIPQHADDTDVLVDKIIGMVIIKLNTKITLTNEKGKLSSITYMDTLSKNQYTIDVTNDSAMSIVNHKQQVCMYDIEGGKQQKNPSICDQKDEEHGKKLHDDFYAFLKELDIDVSELTQYYNWKERRFCKHL